MISKFRLFVIPVLAAAGAGGALVASAIGLGNDDSPMSAVESASIGVEAPDANAAAAALSQEVGFSVEVPELDGTWKFAAADAAKGAAGEEGLRYSTMVFVPITTTGDEPPRDRIDVTQFELRLVHAANDATEPVPFPVLDYDLVVFRGPDQEIYTLRNKSQTFVVSFQGPAALDTVDAINVLASFAK